MVSSFESTRDQRPSISGIVSSVDAKQRNPGFFRSKVGDDVPHEKAATKRPQEEKIERIASVNLDYC
jgi:hypothetical protein